MARSGDFVRHFEGKETLDALLDVAGSDSTTEEVVEVFREASRAGEQVREIIPTLFEGEPRFPDPSLARKLYQNLFGLWDLVERGDKLELGPRERPPKPPKKPKPVAPPPFGKEGPDGAFVETAWRWLEDLDKRDKDRLLHAFENRQDALLSFLDEQAQSGLSDDAYACARFLLFELFSMIEVGHPPGTGQVSEALLAGREQATEPAPAALRAYADEAVFEAEQDEQTPLSPADAAKVRSVVERGLSALWNARK
jgi:hypothetical protein